MRLHDDFTPTPDAAAAHARQQAPDPLPPEPVYAPDVCFKMSGYESCGGCMNRDCLECGLRISWEQWGAPS